MIDGKEPELQEKVADVGDEECATCRRPSPSGEGSVGGMNHIGVQVGSVADGGGALQEEQDEERVFEEVHIFRVAGVGEELTRDDKCGMVQAVGDCEWGLIDGMR